VMLFNRESIFQWQIAIRIDIDVHLVQTLMCWTGDEPSKELDLHRTEQSPEPSAGAIQDSTHFRQCGTPPFQIKN
jgi:hypothetical protein